ncbi:MAG: formylglycine-generating enzyme family protein [Moorea sp. SIO3F7]|nr:formylglycine-generating enzyme family protein [Moorena sp. SIO3E8]NEQ00245.1 formylglycine-generating enzyme family protein [Moorena sp. SIO3F7]
MGQKVTKTNLKSVLNAGLTIHRHQQQADGFTEDLGNGVELEMVAIPEGSFIMGSPETEEGHTNDESPQHRVTVKSFFMGKYPVTQAQWQAVAALPQVNRELEPDPSHFKGKNRPVEQVCWYDAVEFCARLSQQTKWPYRLPSEAEWEYACRAGTTTPFHFGETITTDLANYDGNSTYGSGSKGKYVQETTPVGSFGVANDFGLYDMHGNVWEWCADHWHSNYEDAPTDGSVWEDYNDNDNRNNKRRLLRGGSWFYFPGFCRSGSRYNYNPALRPNLDFIGFRVVCGCAWTL